MLNLLYLGCIQMDTCTLYTRLFVFLHNREWFMTDLFYFTEY